MMTIQCSKCGKSGFTNKGNLSSHMRFCGTGEAAFWKRVTKTDGCWLYKGHTMNTGHADLTRMYVKILAHRYSWMIHFGPIPDGMFVLHKCDTRLCVRPDHLFLGTQADNNHDRHRKGRSARGVDIKRVVLNEDKVRRIRAMRAGGMPYSQIAKVIGCLPSAARDACVKFWKHVQ